MPDLEFDRFEALTFDCYGTLIDWEIGIVTALREMLRPRGELAADDGLLQAYARHEASAEVGTVPPLPGGARPGSSRRRG